MPALCQTLRYLHLYYMSQITRRHPRGLDHRYCSEVICTAATFRSESIDRPQHRRAACKCLLQKVPIENVIAILERSVIPLIRITRERPEPEPLIKARVGDEEAGKAVQGGEASYLCGLDQESSPVTIDIEPAQTSSRFIARSHVWSDGLGNADENSVYYCQLEEIYQNLTRTSSRKSRRNVRCRL